MSKNVYTYGRQTMQMDCGVHTYYEVYLFNSPVYKYDIHEIHTDTNRNC